MVYRLEAGERVVFIGDTRSGKTNLIMALLGGVRRFTVIDSKMHPDEWPRWARQVGAVVTRNPDDIVTNDRVVFQVSEIVLRDRAGWYKPERPGNLWTRALRAVKAKGKGVVVFDEVIQTMPAGGTHPEAWQLYSQGAAFGISGWAGSQIPNRMETLVARQSEHAFSFRMINRADQKILSSCRGIDCAPLASLADYHFGYHRKPASEWLTCPPVPLVITPWKGVKKLAKSPEPEPEAETA